MTESGKQSERYFNDNMLDLLTRTAIQQMSTLYSPAHLPKAKACMELYDGLIDYYKQAQNREAALLTEVAKLWFQKRRLDNFKPYRLTDDELIARLHGLIDTYAGQPACADAYVKLVVACRDANRLKEAVETAREGLAKYSKGEWAKDLQGQIDYITRPMLNVDIPFLYPNYETDSSAKRPTAMPCSSNTGRRFPAASMPSAPRRITSGAIPCCAIHCPARASIC